MVNSLKQTALVTGASSGIGRGITEILQARGLQVYALGRNEEKLTELQSEMGVLPIVLDVTDSNQLAAGLQNLSFDIVINNAGIMPPVGAFSSINEASIVDVIAVNVTAAILLSRIVLPAMLKQNRGHIFYTGSTAGHAAFPNMAVYSATKHAIHGFVASLRAELAGTGVKVTEIVAGRVQTNLYQSVLGKDKSQSLYNDFSPLTPNDVATMVQSVLDMPDHVDISRFDILPHAQYVGGGGHRCSEKS